jgi:MFS family permease
MLNARTLLVICGSTACWAFSFGVGTLVITHYLHALAISDTQIGLAHSFYYLGQAVGSCALPWLNRRLGPVRCTTLGMLMSGLTLAIFPWSSATWVWHALRLLNGWAGAMSLIPLETIVSRDSPPSHKTQNFGYFGLALTIGAAIGMGLGLHVYRPSEMVAFYLGGSVPILVGIFVYPALWSYSRRRETPDLPLPLGWSRNFLSYGTAWCQGFLEGGMLAFLTLFLVARGFSQDDAGLLMGVATVGVILFQVPVTWLADHWGRTLLLLGCYGVVTGTLVLIPNLTNPVPIALALFCFGGCAGAMYPLGLALLGDQMPEACLARAYAWYLAVECVGSQLGAAAMGKARDAWGDSSMFAVGLAAVLLVLTLWGMLRFKQRRPVRSGAPNGANPLKRGVAG